ncbi:hypothetical protein HT136_08165 [Novosphingobium profundi]|uniref:hypothetical protein n=1 Tax=Novosphingobium profundi TaxID=1774954 RepID=UPI001BD91D55|nr:hypothetical protein [Novosphingobium profundi]MBT0668341.1 hypothetical protein [Novosphingobium profundi]
MQHSFRFLARNWLALAFALAGTISRCTFRYFETRWQILIFLALALAFEALAFAMGRKPSWLRLGRNATAATIAILAAKWLLEIVIPLAARLGRMALRNLG